jgi:DNA-binding NtrC family response regulator
VSVEDEKANFFTGSEAMAALQGYHWPGNVRELRNVLERATILCRGGEIQPKDLYLNEGSTSQASLETNVSMPAPSLGTLDQQLKDLERTRILETLARNQNNKMKTGRELGMPLSTLWRKLKAYQEEGGVSPSWGRAPYLGRSYRIVG